MLHLRKHLKLKLARAEINTLR